MQLSDFDYRLPEELIASYPLAQRTQSRLLCMSRHGGEISHRQFPDILDFILPGDLLILNNTRVIPARLFAYKPTGGKVELLVERILSPNQALVHLRASKGVKLGSVLDIQQTDNMMIESRLDNLWQVRFSRDVLSVLDESGEIPLPPYFKRMPQEEDKIRYQTVFATQEGAVAAPTAGLHFDTALLEKLQEKGVNIAYVTLHVGAGTFQPIRVEDIQTHQMHYEWMKIDQHTCDLINQTKQSGKRVIAVGTTSVRTLESAARFSPESQIMPYEGDTNLFIYPGFTYQVVDAIITNFHLPKSSLLLLISAFSSREFILKAYQEAIDQSYRFYSYGDAMFIYA